MLVVRCRCSVSHVCVLAPGCRHERSRTVGVSDLLRADRFTQGDEHQRPDPAAQSETPPAVLSVSLHSLPVSNIISCCYSPPQFHDSSKSSAANYISQHVQTVKSVYVRAVATYALTLHDPNSVEASELLSSLEKLAREKGVCHVFSVQIFTCDTLRMMVVDDEMFSLLRRTSSSSTETQREFLPSQVSAVETH